MEERREEEVKKSKLAAFDSRELANAAGARSIHFAFIHCVCIRIYKDSSVDINYYTCTINILDECNN